MSFKAYIDNTQAKTGKTPDEFKKFARTEGLLQIDGSLNTGIRADIVAGSFVAPHQKPCN